MKNVLITGGTGLIGIQLTNALLQEGFNVSHLSRSKPEQGIVPTFVWDIEKAFIEKEALNNVDVIIHLAGAGITGERWTKKRKHEIIKSRVESANLLFEYVKARQIKLDVFISASGTGYYGAITSEHIFTEDDAPAKDFLGEICMKWEQAADRFLALDTRVVKIRTGIVLSKSGGALEKLVSPVKYFVGSPLGSGKQYMPWIHIDDLVNIYIKAIKENTMSGAYNAVAPDYVTNTEFTKSIAKILKRPLFLPAVPAFFLKIILGEMAVIVLTGSRVSCEKIQKTGPGFKFPQLNEALENLLH